MTVAQLSKILAAYIARGAGDSEVTVFQWDHGQQSLDAVETRPDGTVELYSNSVSGHPVRAVVVTDDDLDDLI